MIPTEPIGSIPRPTELIEATGSPVISDGEQRNCGFAPFGDDRSTSRELAFAKIRARAQGTALAADALGLASVS